LIVADDFLDHGGFRGSSGVLPERSVHATDAANVSAG